MRRKEREISVLQDILKVVDNCKVCRIGMLDNGEIYIVPMNFGYEYKDNILSLYFHCAKEGRKIEILKINRHIGFEMDGKHQLITSDIACKNSYSYESIIGVGDVFFIDTPSEKVDALNLIMKHQTEKEFPINEQMVNSVTLFKIMVKTFSCKSHQQN